MTILEHINREMENLGFVYNNFSFVRSSYSFLYEAIFFFFLPLSHLQLFILGREIYLSLSLLFYVYLTHLGACCVNSYRQQS